MKNNTTMEMLMDNDNRYIGRVVKFYPEKGYGFIRSKNENKSHFVHISQIVGDGSLQIGDTVEFSIRISKKTNKEQAENVLVIENR